MKRLVFIFLILFLFFVTAKPCFAIYDPSSASNNRVGIHIGSETDLEDAKNLVNSSGGDWGYVTVVIREDERDIIRWQKTFDQMRRDHLIPIIRLATHDNGQGWEKFESSDIADWVFFLNSLNWVVKNRYVVIANEVNRTSEWGGEVNSSEYSNILCDFYSQLKSASDDFFVLPAGLDASAPNSKLYMSEEKYLKEMITSNPNVFSCMNGWNSHSYPNPNFSGSVDEWGRGTVRTYKWELEYLKSLGLNKNLPVFITETGWKHNGGDKKLKFISPDEAGIRLSSAFQNAWNDPNIIAVTPFILNYPQEPFNNFSFKDKAGNFYTMYNSLRALTKVEGRPIQENRGEITYALYPKIAFAGNIIEGVVFVKNTGQSIWTDAYLNGTKIDKAVEPGKSVWITVKIAIPATGGSVNGKFVITLDGKEISSNYNYEVTVLEIPKGFWSYIKEKLCEPGASRTLNLFLKRELLCH